jgi:hypothetical protein
VGLKRPGSKFKLPLSLSYCLETPATPLVTRAVALLARELARRGGVTLVPLASGPADLHLEVAPVGAAEGFTVRPEPRGGMRLIGHDDRGLLYGLGHLLRTASWQTDAVQLARWQGSSVPGKSWRGIYLAHNFQNWYVSAPLAEVLDYLGDLALWGLNTLAFNFAFAALGDPANPDHQQRLDRYRRVLQEAHELGFRTGLLFCANADCACVLPDEARAVPFPDSTPARRGFNEKFVCPSHPAGRQALNQWYADCLGLFAGTPISFVVAFPYDAGGCGCSQCWPWGYKGYLSLTGDLAKHTQQIFPGAKLVLSTWCFDVREESDGEYAGLDRAIRAGAAPWVDLLMTDAHGSFPDWPLAHGSPGGLPMINFPEISMWGRYPWGGSGANAFPQRLGTLWPPAEPLLSGGLPYSEGRFEDLNKFICAGLYWQPQAAVADLVRGYLAYYLGQAVAETAAQAVALLEANYPSETMTLERAEPAGELLQQVAEKLPERVRCDWRWRLLWLRALIDVETLRSPAMISVARNAAYEELTQLYCAQGAGSPVAPRAQSFYQRPDVPHKGPVFAAHIGEQASRV